jgi:hypothetical protein
MKVHLSFDVEVWCNGWARLDEVFPAQFERYVYGRSRYGDYALPETLAILQRHGLHGTFFVEPLFAARFGAEHLATIVGLIRESGQEVQLHLHPEWVDEIRPPLIAAHTTKRQHLCHYDLAEQTALLAYGRDALQRAGSGPITAFRAGSYAADANTYAALARNSILVDSSINDLYAVSGADLRAGRLPNTPFRCSGVSSFPVSVFRDGFGRARPAQVGACSFEEMRDALAGAHAAGWTDFVIVSHNFELLRTDSCDPDRTVVRRFERLCAHLAAHPEIYDVCGFVELPRCGAALVAVAPPPAVAWAATARRYAEQLQRRIG